MLMLVLLPMLLQMLLLQMLTRACGFIVSIADTRTNVLLRMLLQVFTREWDFVKTGVTTDEATRLNAYIMIASAFLYLSPQV